MSTRSNRDHSPSEVGSEVVEVTGAGLRALELGLVILIGLLVTPPLLILVVVVAVPTALIMALVAAVVAVIEGPTAVIRLVRAHHHSHGSTLFIHRFFIHRAVPIPHLFSHRLRS
jgi:hypothetical protein